jgi:5-methylcytosine-specific restriction endonuclease McrA
MARNHEEYNAYMAAYMKRRQQQRRAKAIDQLGGRCVRCGSVEDLQFDHIDPASKVLDIGKIWGASEERFQAEISKCQLLCYPCHSRKTTEERGFKVAKGTHGTLSALRYCNPPCELCREARNKHAREWKRKRR